MSIEVAHANFATLCTGSSPSYSCSLTRTIPSPSAMSVTVTDASASEQVNVSWTVSCTDGAATLSQQGATNNAPTPLAVQLAPLPATADGQCNVTANVSLSSTQPSGTTFTPTTFEAVLNYTPATSPTATATPTATASTPAPPGAPVHPVKGFGGKCVDDNGNSSANRAKVQIWNCSSTDHAENWTFSNGEFKHNGKCMNDQGNGGIRSHVILWSCNGASNEKWSELANGELKLQSHGGTLCLDDPRSSTTNGTQLIVYTCTDNANQKWSLP